MRQAGLRDQSSDWSNRDSTEGRTLLNEKLRDDPAHLPACPTFMLLQSIKKRSDKEVGFNPKEKLFQLFMFDRFVSCERAITGPITV